MSLGPGIWLVRPESEALATTLQNQLGGMLYRPWLSNSIAQKDQFAAAFRLHKQWIMIAASGIAVRFMNGLAQDKHSDPAVVVLDEAGTFCRFAAGRSRRRRQSPGLSSRQCCRCGAGDHYRDRGIETFGGRHRLSQKCSRCTHHRRRSTSAGQSSHQRNTRDRNHRLESQRAGLLEFCEQYHVPLRVLAHETVAARAWVTQPSDWVQKNVGLPGVCEPCALIASPRGRLIMPKTALDGVAVAVVEDKL